MILIAIPVTQKISARIKVIQKELSQVRDERVKLNNEVLGGIKVIKATRPTCAVFMTNMPQHIFSRDIPSQTHMLFYSSSIQLTCYA